MENPEINPSAPAPSHIWNWISAIALIVAVVALVTIYTQISKANADYICTYIVEENDPCGNGSWDSWQTISSTGDHSQCTQSTTERRVYTGTRETRHILQYLTLRTGCDAAYTQGSYGDSGGASGFHGGSIVSETAACQIEEIRTTADSASCVPVSEGGSGGTGSDTTTTSSQTDINLSTQTTEISGIGQLNQFRESKIDGQITADPERLRSGTPTTVQWQGVEVTSCTVTGSNGDSWTGTAGQQLSSPLDTSTTFTLNCTAFNNTNVQDSVEVTVVPSFQEI